jgi:membrane fusion protein, multidrug efflux system
MSAPSPGPCLSLCVFALLLGACKADQAADPAEPVRPVLTAVVSGESSKLLGPFAGVIEPRYTTDVGFQIAGRIVARDVDVGDLVSKGERIAALDPTLERFHLASAEAGVASAQAQLTRARDEATRQKWLLTTGASTQANVDVAVANLGTAQAALEQAQAAVKESQNQLGYTTLNADFDGVITARSGEVGQVVAAGQKVFTLARPDIREAVFDVPDPVVDVVRTEGAFSISLLADPSVKADGRVREIAPSADPTTRTRRIRLTLSDPPIAFRLGSTVLVSITQPTSPQAVVPAAALLEENGSSAVWIADPKTGKVRKVAVKTLARSTDRAVVVGHLGAGERVVIAGLHSLSEGQSVKVEESP